jgi:hypothetical protein
MTSRKADIAQGDPWDGVHKNLDLVLTKIRECFQLASEARGLAIEAGNEAVEAGRIADQLSAETTRLRRKSLLFDESEFKE